MSAQVLLGMGGCVDHEIVWDAAGIEALARRHAIGLQDLERSPAGAGGPVRDERDILLVLLTLMAAGAGGERFVEDAAALLAFAHRFTTSVTLGGSSVRAAVALDRLGIGTVLHLVSIDDDVRRLLPATAERLCSAEQDSTDPHVIVQFPAGASIGLRDGVVVAPRADRLILVNDPPNQELRVADGFGDAVAQARVIVVSGLNTMTSPEAVTDRANEIREHLGRRRPDAVVVYEDAGFHDDTHRAAVMSALRDVVDIWGMNEDEAQHYLRRRLETADPERVAAAAEELRVMLDVPTLVLHTGDWVLAHGRDDLAAALRSGVSTATARYAHGDDWRPADRDAIAARDVDPERADVARRVERLLGAPSAVVPIPQLPVLRPTTIGLGDTFLGGLVAALVEP